MNHDKQRALEVLVARLQEEPARAVLADLFDGYASIAEAVDHWSDLTDQHVAFTPKGQMVTRELIMAFAEIALVYRTVEAALRQRLPEETLRRLADALDGSFWTLR